MNRAAWLTLPYSVSMVLALSAKNGVWLHQFLLWEPFYSHCFHLEDSGSPECTPAAKRQRQDSSFSTLLQNERLKGTDESSQHDTEGTPGRYASYELKCDAKAFGSPEPCALFHWGCDIESESGSNVSPHWECDIEGSGLPERCASPNLEYDVEETGSPEENASPHWEYDTSGSSSDRERPESVIQFFATSSQFSHGASEISDVLYSRVSI
jgi:hypothetical protein